MKVRGAHRRCERARATLPIPRSAVSPSPVCEKRPERTLISGYADEEGVRDDDDREIFYNAAPPMRFLLVDHGSFSSSLESIHFPFSS